MLVPFQQQAKLNQKNFRISELYQLGFLLSRQLIGDHIQSLDPLDWSYSNIDQPHVPLPKAETLS